jgi:hypothetical protein
LLEVLEYLWDVGPVEATAMGIQPVSWSSIAAYQQATGIRLDAWEATQVRMLSLAYLDQHTRSQDANCPAPWTDPDFVDHEALGQRIKRQFRAFNKRRRQAK